MPSRNPSDDRAPPQGPGHIVPRGFRKYDVIEGVILAEGVTYGEAHAIADDARQRVIIPRGFGKHDVYEGVVLAERVTKDQAEALAPPPRPASLSAAASPAVDEREPSPSDLAEFPNNARRRRLAKLVPKDWCKDDARKAIAEAMATNPTIVKFPAKPRPARPRSPVVIPAAEPKAPKKVVDELGGGGAWIDDNVQGRELIVIALNVIYRQSLAMHHKKEKSPKRGWQRRKKPRSLPKDGWHRDAMDAFLRRRAPWADERTRQDFYCDAYELDRPEYTPYEIGDAFGAHIDKEVAAVIVELNLPNIRVRDPDREAARKLAHAEATRQWRARQPKQCATKGCCNLLKDKRAGARFCSDACQKRAKRAERAST
jgi:hypothetical protein